MTPAELDEVLRGVSRSFYLSLRVLPGEVRPQLSLAYLLARASDTVADSRAVPRPRRLELLRRMQDGDFGSVAGLAEDQALPEERVLLRRLGELARPLARLGEADQKLIRELLGTIVSGQIFDLERFPGESAEAAAALSDDAELDRYTYLVAGCVGEFWTRLCAARLPAFAALDQARMRELGVRLGKGLQLVNILRDPAADLRIGRCYLPVARPERLLEPDGFAAIKPVYDRWLGAALEHLDAGWDYALSIPPRLWRLRLACIWPIWLGLGTIAGLRRADPLRERVSVGQGRVYAWLAWSALCCGSDRLLDRTYRGLRREAGA
ncbi:MAG: squalene/phytoene synthase family protein [Elusimicrobia bacterium]|nr:squalene/phytoene synthase family protein [Elusimicrobiota bacterium]